VKTKNSAASQEKPEKLGKKEAKLQKQALKAEKKKAKKEKKRLRVQNRAILYDPSKMNGFPLSIPIGYFLRFFSIGFSIFGICMLLADALNILSISVWLLLLYCVLVVSAFSMIFIGKKLILAGIGCLSAWILLLFAIGSNPASFYVSGFVRVYNQTMYRLDEWGFASAAQLSVPSFGEIEDNFALLGGICAIATLLAIVFSAFSAKRTRMLPIVLVGGSLCVFCFTYNLCTTNIGISCILAGLCAMLVLSGYDKIYAAHKQSRKSRAYSGYSSALAGLLAFAIVSIPASLCTGSFREISFISNPMQTARTYLTTILTGGNPKWNVMNSLVNTRTTKLESLEFDGTELFSVSLPMSRRNVYLRSWIASDYQYSGDNWNILSDDDYQEMSTTLKNEESNLTGDAVNYYLSSLFDEQLLTATDDGYYARVDRGYYAAYVDVQYLNNNGLLYLLPSSFVPSFGLSEYANHTISYSDSIYLYSDGIYESSWLNLQKEYSAYAILPTYISSKYASYADKQSAYYQFLVEFIQQDVRKYAGATDEYLLNLFTEKLEERGLSDMGTAPIESYLTSSNRKKWIARYITQIQEYSEYVKSQYTDYPTESLGIAEISQAISEDFESAETTYDKLMTVINYLILNYTYTETPDEPSGEYESDLDSFLLETKNGYCVQFATAATLLFRSLGIPARYVQGYIASDFTKDRSSDNGSYTTIVRDSDAHAWVEVWIDGLGWLTLETTPSYYENLYYIATDSSDSSDPIQSVIEAQTTTTSLPQASTPTTEKTTAVTTAPNSSEEETLVVSVSTEDVVKMASLLLVLALLSLAGFILYKRAEKVSLARKYFVERAVYGSFADEQDALLVSGALSDSIYEILYILGHRPKTGEQPLEFAYRVDHPPRPQSKAEVAAVQRQLLWSHTFTEVTEILEKREFASSLTREEISVLGEFLDSLLKTEYKSLSLPKKIWYRYLRRMI
jgi:transglutaminase-like putative cysteine protease